MAKTKKASVKKTTSGGMFGLQTSEKTSKVLLMPVPWEVTTSYGGGTASGPQAILEASPQLDLFDLDFGDVSDRGFHLLEEDAWIKKTNVTLRKSAQKVINEWNIKGAISKDKIKIQNDVNAGCAKMVSHVYNWAKDVLLQDKVPTLIGGDHSTPLGLIQAICEEYPNVGVLHIDAHADLRLSYMGFHHSHASIMRNVCTLKTPPAKLVQVAIRDFCKEEHDYIEANPKRIRTFFDRELKQKLFSGKSWNEVCQEILSQLPNEVYVSFDIDGLSPEFCPSTGTPVAGGLSFDQAVQLIVLLAKSGKQIVGFDLNEVAPSKDSEWDGNVGARMLYKLCSAVVVSNKL